jgi:carbamate kinase
LPEGSMRPKIEAALGFTGETLITSFDALADALAGTAGTRILPRSGVEGGGREAAS